MEACRSELGLAGTATLDLFMLARGVDPTSQTHCLTSKDVVSLMITVLGADRVGSMSERQFTTSMRRFEKMVAEGLRRNLAGLVAQ